MRLVLHTAYASSGVARNLRQQRMLYKVVQGRASYPQLVSSYYLAIPLV